MLGLARLGRALPKELTIDCLLDSRPRLGATVASNFRDGDTFFAEMLAFHMLDRLSRPESKS